MFRSVSFPSSALPSKLHSPGSHVSRLLAHGRLRGWKEGRSQSIPHPPCFRDILGQQLHLLHGTNSCWTDPPYFLLPPVGETGIPSPGLLHRYLLLCLHPRGYDGFLLLLLSNLVFPVWLSVPPVTFMTNSLS